VAIISNATTIADAGAFSVGLGSMVHIKTLTASGVQQPCHSYMVQQM
jgi:hypothetical protein